MIATNYTALVAGTCLWVLIANQIRYQRSKKKEPLSAYQRSKFLSIWLAQSVAFYLIPFILPALWQEGGFFNDPAKLASKSAHVYIYPAFQSVGLAVYLFLVITGAGQLFRPHCPTQAGTLSTAFGKT